MDEYKMIEKGRIEHLDELEELYEKLNHYLADHINYPGWIKNIYPTKETASLGINEEALYILKINGKIAGSIILSHIPEKAYEQVQWKVNEHYDHIIVIRTLVTHPEFMRQKIALQLMNFTEEYAKKQHIKSIRLDVSEHNLPAIALYEKLNYQYIKTVDLGLNYPHLKWFKLYEKIL